MQKKKRKKRGKEGERKKGRRYRVLKWWLRFQDFSFYFFRS